MLIIGEVHTGLLRGNAPVTSEEARRVADLVVGEPVLVWERPIAYVRSPAVPVGVDCVLNPCGAARQTRGVGTVLQRTAVTAGQLVQGSAYTTIERTAATMRLPWSHYLARPGVIEIHGRVRWPELAADLAVPQPGALDLNAVATRAVDRVQNAMRVQKPPRLRTARTRLRWLAETGGDGDVSVRFGLGRDDRRLVRLATPPATADALAGLCEDIALHDWLLTTLIETIRKAAIGLLSREEALRRLTPAIDCLLHLWMPDARGDDISSRVWAILETRPGFTRQWDTLVHRIRDQLSAGAVAALAAAGDR